MSSNIDRRELSPEGAIMRLGEWHSLFTRVPPLVAGRYASQLRSLSIELPGLGETELLLEFSLGNTYGQLGTSFMPYSGAETGGTYQSDPSERVKAFAGLPLEKLICKQHGEDRFAFLIYSDSDHLRATGIIGPELNHTEGTHTSFTMPESVKEYFKRLRIMIDIPGQKKQAFEGRFSERVISMDSYLLLDSFYPLETGPIPFSEDQTDLIYELLTRRFERPGEHGIDVENLLFIRDGYDLRLPYGGKMMQPLISFRLEPERISREK